MKPFTVMRVPLQLEVCHAVATCPPGPYGYRVHMGRITKSQILDLWVMAFAETVWMGLGCSGSNKDLPLAHMLAHALEHFVVLDLITRQQCHRTMFPPEAILGVSGLMDHGSDVAPEIAIFYIRSGFAVSARQELKSVERTIRKVYAALYPWTWLLR